MMSFKNGDNDMISTKRTAEIDGDNHMNTNRQAATIKERTMKPTAANLICWAGVSALVAGISIVVVGIIHPAHLFPSVTTPRFGIAHSLMTIAMSYFGLLGITGLYARQVKEAGWLGLAGYLLFSLWLALIAPFTFAEAAILPLLTTAAPTFVEGFLGIFNGHPVETNLGALPTLYKLSGPLYILGGLVFGIATFRAGILPRWAAGLLAVGAALAPAAGLLSHEHQPKVVVPVGLALAWLGYALWADRGAHAAAPAPGQIIPQLGQTGAE